MLEQDATEVDKSEFASCYQHSRVDMNWLMRGSTSVRLLYPCGDLHDANGQWCASRDGACWLYLWIMGDWGQVGVEAGCQTRLRPERTGADRLKAR